MQDRYLCCPPIFPRPRSAPPHFFYSRIATEYKVESVNNLFEIGFQLMLFQHVIICKS